MIYDQTDNKLKVQCASNSEISSDILSGLFKTTILFDQSIGNERRNQFRFRESVVTSKLMQINLSKINPVVEQRKRNLY